MVLIVNHNTIVRCGVISNHLSSVFLRTDESTNELIEAKSFWTCHINNPIHRCF
ncbi:hypothetical protein D3C84_1206160 [compost metagenome]